MSRTELFDQNNTLKFSFHGIDCAYAPSEQWVTLGNSSFNVEAASPELQREIANRMAGRDATAAFDALRKEQTADGIHSVVSDALMLLGIEPYDDWAEIIHVLTCRLPLTPLDGKGAPVVAPWWLLPFMELAESRWSALETVADHLRLAHREV